jgi:hypothetical protein
MILPDVSLGCERTTNPDETGTHLSGALLQSFDSDISTARKYTF